MPPPPPPPPPSPVPPSAKPGMGNVFAQINALRDKAQGASLKHVESPKDKKPETSPKGVGDRSQPGQPQPTTPRTPMSNMFAEMIACQAARSGKPRGDLKMPEKKDSAPTPVDYRSVLRKTTTAASQKPVDNKQPGQSQPTAVRTPQMVARTQPATPQTSGVKGGRQPPAISSTPSLSKTSLLVTDPATKRSKTPKQSVVSVPDEKKPDQNFGPK